MNASPAPAEIRHAGTIDLTPTWRALMPALLAAVRDGTDLGRQLAADELYRLADFADAANAGER